MHKGNRMHGVDLRVLQPALLHVTLFVCVGQSKCGMMEGWPHRKAQRTYLPHHPSQQEMTNPRTLFMLTTRRALSPEPIRRA